MKKVDKRVENNTRSLFALRDFLVEITQDPVLFISDEQLPNILMSQGALSRYSDKSRGISASSINTIKRTCEKVFDGGFDAFDKLRVDAIYAIKSEHQQKNKPKKVTRESTAARIVELQNSNRSLKHDLFLMTHLLEVSMRQSRYYASQSLQDSLPPLCEKEQKEIRAYLSLVADPELLNRDKDLEKNRAK